MKRSYTDWFIVYLTQQDGIGWHTIHAIVQNDLLLIENWTEELLKKYVSHAARIGLLLKAKQSYNQHTIVKMKDDECIYQYESILWNESDYPAILRECVQPPWVIYIKGRKELLHSVMLAIVGTRAPTPYGLAITKQICKEFAQLGFTIVSGLAGGIDTIAHKSSIGLPGSTIAILPCGIKHCYPQSNYTLYNKLNIEGLLISETVETKVVHKGLFTQRNRIIAGLAFATIVVEGELKSGSMITARYVSEMNRELYAIPGSVFSAKSKGPNFLIYKGYARMLMNSSQLHEDLPWLVALLKQTINNEKKMLDENEQKIETVKKVILTDEENIVLQHIQNHPLTIDDLVQSTPYSYEQLNVILLQLSIKHCIRLHHGSLYIAL